MYATIAQARAAGATGSDADVEALIEAAMVRVDMHTREWWEPRTATVVARVEVDGTCLLPRRVRVVDTVTPRVRAGVTATALPATAYRVSTSATLGDVDAVLIGSGAGGGWDDLVAGAESWAGGWAGLFGRWAAEQVEVAGEWGHDAPPSAVSQATALVAAWIQEQAAGGLTDPDATSGLDVDDEGNNVRITPRQPGPDEGVPGRRPTTGVPAADALLIPYLRTGPLLEGV